MHLLKIMVKFGMDELTNAPNVCGYCYNININVASAANQAQKSATQKPGQK